MVHLSSLKKDELIVLRPGNIVPADGIVIKGFARIDESRLSGKKTPVEKRENAHLYANSIVLEGALTMRVEQTGATTAMMRLRLMAEDTARSHRYATPLNGFGTMLFPYMCLAALITFVGWYFAEGEPMMAIAAALSVCASQCTTAFSLASSEPVIHTAMDSADHHILFKDIRAENNRGLVLYVQTYENERSEIKDIRFENVVSNGKVFDKKSIGNEKLYAASTQVFDAEKDLSIIENPTCL